MQKPPSLSKFLNFFAIIMILVYFVFGFFVIFSKSFDYVPKEIRFAFGIFLIAYGFFRAVRLYFKLRQQRYDYSDED